MRARAIWLTAARGVTDPSGIGPRGHHKSRAPWADGVHVPWQVKILVVDDDPITLRATTSILTRAGFEVVRHDSGFGLAHAITRHRPDLLVLDLSMPGLCGDAAVRTYRGLQSEFVLDIPVVVLSGLPAHEIGSRARAAGATAWLQKPGLDALVPAVKKALANHELQRFATG